MTEYINRKDAINGFVKMLKQSGDIYPTDITTMLQSIPPADVRPVIRCRDCFANGLCSVQDILFYNDVDRVEDFFCANGKREE